MQRSKLVGPFFKLLFTQPRLILKSLYHGMAEYQSKKICSDTYDQANGLREVSIHDLFKDFNEEIDPFSHLYGTSMPIDLAVIKKIVKEKGKCDYLEIGSWRGESLANIAPHCNRCVSISLSDDDMKRLNIDDRTISMQRFFSKHISNIEHIGADSTTFDFSSLGKFDVIFVDGDHRYEAVKRDTENAFSLLRDENSIILWHDYTKHYEQINWEVFAGILAGTHPDKRSKIHHITNTLLAIYSNKSYPTKEYIFPQIPDKIFSLKITSHPIQ